MPLKMYEPGMNRVASSYETWERPLLRMLAGSTGLFLAAWAITPVEIVLPVYAGLMMTAGFLLALYAWLIGDRQVVPRVTFWDMSGTCLLLGFFAGALADHEHVANMSVFAAG